MTSEYRYRAPRDSCDPMAYLTTFMSSDMAHDFLGFLSDRGLPCTVLTHCKRLSKLIKKLKEEGHMQNKQMCRYYDIDDWRFTSHIKTAFPKVYWQSYNRLLKFRKYLAGCYDQQ